MNNDKEIVSHTKENDVNIYEKLNQLLETCTDEESKEALKSAINGLKYIENALKIVDDIIIKIVNNEDKTIANIVFRTNGGFHYNISEKEMTGCFVRDIDSYNDNEVTYKISLDTDI